MTSLFCMLPCIMVLIHILSPMTLCVIIVLLLVRYSSLYVNIFYTFIINIFTFIYVQILKQNFIKMALVNHCYP